MGFTKYSLNAQKINPATMPTKTPELFTITNGKILFDVEPFKDGLLTFHLENIENLVRVGLDADETRALISFLEKQLDSIK